LDSKKVLVHVLGVLIDHKGKLTVLENSSFPIICELIRFFGKFVSPSVDYKTCSLGRESQAEDRARKTAKNLGVEKHLLGPEKEDIERTVQKVDAVMRSFTQHVSSPLFLPPKLLDLLKNLYSHFKLTKNCTALISSRKILGRKVPMSHSFLLSLIFLLHHLKIKFC
jgi:hypothetical protein